MWTPDPQFQQHLGRIISRAFDEAREQEGRNKILPVWHGVTQGEVAGLSPLLAGVFAANTEAGIDAVVDQISATLKT